MGLDITRLDIESTDPVAERFYELAEKSWAEAGSNHPYNPDREVISNLVDRAVIDVIAVKDNDELVGYALVCLQKNLFSSVRQADVLSLYLEKAYRNKANLRAVMNYLKALYQDVAAEIVIHKPKHYRNGLKCDLTYIVRLD